MTQPSPQPPPGDPWLLPDDGIIDPVAVQIAASGARRVALTPPERLHAAAVILAAGGGAHRVAERLRVGRHTAQRLCRDARDLTAIPPDEWACQRCGLAFYGAAPGHGLCPCCLAGAA